MYYVFAAVGSVALAGLIYWVAVERSRVFTIRISSGRASLIRGKVAQVFVADVADIARRNHIQRGRIFGVRKSGRITLGFSVAIPRQFHQSFRNVWVGHNR